MRLPGNRVHCYNKLQAVHVNLQTSSRPAHHHASRQLMATLRSMWTFFSVFAAYSHKITTAIVGQTCDTALGLHHHRHRKISSTPIQRRP